MSRHEAGARAAGGGAHEEDECDRPQSARLLLWVAAALFLLVGASWLLSHVHLGRWASPVTLTFSGIKACLIAWYFMELGEARTSIRAAALSAVLLFLLLVGLASTDVATRETAPLVPPATAR